MRTELTHIVHCAWLLNFNIILSSFKTHLQGVRNIIDLALSSPRPSPPHITFVSSVAVVAGWPGPAPEASLETPATCLKQGYAHSKYVAEKIIERAVSQCPKIKATIIRSGQISGAEVTGAWSPKEHMPILLKSCRDFGVVPDDLPVNFTSEALHSA
jgi:thioester reductase-like protein